MSLHERRPFDDAVEAVVAARADDQNRYKRQQSHQVGVSGTVAERSVADPEQGRQEDPACGGQPGQDPDSARAR